MSPSPPAADDVRMRGFLRRTPVTEALAWVDSQTPRLPAEAAPLEDSFGRVLAHPLTAPIDVPGFDRSAMDGFALRSAETTGAGDYNPLSFRVVGESLPGRPWTGHVAAGRAVRIMTGAPLPDGADAVLPAEFAREREQLIEACAAVPPGKHVGRQGEDIRRGTEVLPAERVLRPQDVGVAASLGLASFTVVRRPRVRIIVTGNELAAPGGPKGPHDIYEANSFLLRGLVERDGGVLESVRLLRDDAEAIEHALIEPGVDVILVSGGSSVGREDHAPSIVARAGELPIHGVAMRPSSPAGLGRIGAALVCLLPGNPVSCLCAYDFFAGRAIRRLGGRSPDWPYPSVAGPLTRKLVSEIGRTDYCRVRITADGIEPLALSGASMLSSTTRADGFVVVPDDSEGYASGTLVTAYRYDRG